MALKSSTCLSIKEHSGRESHQPGQGTIYKMIGEWEQTAGRRTLRTQFFENSRDLSILADNRFSFSRRLGKGESRGVFLYPRGKSTRAEMSLKSSTCLSIKEHLGRKSHQPGQEMIYKMIGGWEVDSGFRNKEWSNHETVKTLSDGQPSSFYRQSRMHLATLGPRDCHTHNRALSPLLPESLKDESMTATPTPP
ncbi:hypothetical protein CEXT_722191 [Caerostris extrusa]|uniref:Uncharacterized protein n=1 Tax=Caerostris extrusa TaxID=172846 RepID=A0AAV4Y3B1_CAEEX|nr:hypothetical protein CEXT_722191 [Caerostris extrusa]